LSSALNAVAGRLVSPAPSSTFNRCRPGPRGLPGLTALSWSPIRQAVRSNHSISALVAFTSPSERSRSSGNSSQLPKKPEFLLSWDSPAWRPSAVLPSARPLPEAEASFGPTKPFVESCSALVVSHHLDGLLRAGAAGLLHPAAGHGVRRVSCFRLPHTSEDGLEARHISRAAGHTLRRVPLISSRTASLRPLPSCRFCTFSSPEPPRPEGRAPNDLGDRGHLLQVGHQRGPRPSPATHATFSRSVGWCGAAPLAEAAGVAHALDGRSLRGRCSLPGLAPPTAGLASPPKRTASRFGLRDGRMTAGRAPRGPDCLPRPKSRVTSTDHRSGAMAHRPPRWRDGFEEPVLCPGDAPIRRSGPPRHQTGLEPSGEPVDSAPVSLASPRPEGLGLSCVGNVPTEREVPC
jgi:hypothetical protein